jgi:hypothetical protein
MKNIPHRLQKMSAAATAGAGATATTVTLADLPPEKTLLHAAKIAMEKDKPILLDYYRETRAATAFIGVDKDTREEFLVKNREEYTSPIVKKYKAGTEMLVETENSIYVVALSTQKKDVAGFDSA